MTAVGLALVVALVVALTALAVATLALAGHYRLTNYLEQLQPDGGCPVCGHRVGGQRQTAPPPTKRRVPWHMPEPRPTDRERDTA